jgi:predicted DCC family thiol-disulfide oxidoreductase YuxK
MNANSTFADRPKMTTRAAYIAYSYRDDPLVPPFPDDKPIIVFDGYCALCSAWAQFVLRHDLRATYRLLAAQSELGHALYAHYGLPVGNYTTNILLAEGNAWFRSEGCIRMAAGLGFPWRLAVFARMLPAKLRDALYNWIALNRITWFGHRGSCYVPTNEFGNRFLG